MLRTATGSAALQEIDKRGCGNLPPTPLAVKKRLKTPQKPQIRPFSGAARRGRDHQLRTDRLRPSTAPFLPEFARKFPGLIITWAESRNRGQKFRLYPIFPTALSQLNGPANTRATHRSAH